MQVGAGDPPGSPDLAQDLALRQDVPLFDGDLRKVGVIGKKAVAVVQDDGVPLIEEAARQDDLAAGRGLDLRALGGAQVGAGM